MNVKNEKGSALIMALVLTVILSFIGASLLQYALSEASLVAMNHKYMQAYYIARSGADATAAYIINNPGSASGLINQTSSQSTLGPGKFDVKVTGSSVGPLTIQSTGYVGNAKKTVYLTLNYFKPPAPQYDMALFALNSIQLDPTTRISGMVGTNSVSSGGVDFDWSTSITNGPLYIGPDGSAQDVVVYPQWANINDMVPGGLAGVKNLSALQSYPLPDFPTFPSLPTKPSLHIQGGSSNDLTISGDGFYPAIVVENDRKLTIQLNSGETRIRVGTLNMQQGHIVLQGTGTVTFYVDTNFTLTGSSTVNVNLINHKWNSNGDPNSVFMYYAGTDNNGGSISCGGDTKFAGNIYIQSATITITNSGGLLGNIITGGSKVCISGDASAEIRALYAPNAAVSMIEGGKLKGAIICKSFSSSGNISVTYDQSIQNSFPLTIGSSAGYQKGLWQ